MHPHAAGALDKRLQDDSGNFPLKPAQHLVEALGRDRHNRGT
jgi:hypothetical protein